MKALVLIAVMGFAASVAHSEVATKKTAGTKAAKDASQNSVSLEDVIKLQKDLNKSKDLQMSFKQEKYTHSRKRARPRTGKVLISSPHSFRWVFETPLAEEWIYNGKELFNYHRDLNEAARFDVKGSKAKEVQSIVNMVRDVEALLKRYTFESAQREQDLVTVLLKSDGNDGVEQVTLKIDTKENFISYLKVKFRNQNFLATRFNSPVRTNIEPSAFSPPKGVKISNSGF